MEKGVGNSPSKQGAANGPKPSRVHIFRLLVVLGLDAPWELPELSWFSALARVLCGMGE